MNIFFGYFDLGLRAMNAARLGMQVAGDNISNANTPGYVRRRLELQPGFPIQVQGGQLDSGVEVARISRMEDRFLQANLEREQGSLGESGERLRGLMDLEAIYGNLDGSGLAGSLSAFSSAFTQLAGQPEGTAQRRAAVSAADDLARMLRDTYQRVRQQQSGEDQAISVTVEKVNNLASQLASLNEQIHATEIDGTIAAPLRDRRSQVLEQLVELTGGTVVNSPNGKVGFSLPGGPTLVTADTASSNPIELVGVRNAQGLLQIQAGGRLTDVTASLRGGRLGAMLYLRDEAVQTQLSELDALASDLAARVNALTTSGVDGSGNPTGPYDLRGNPGGPVFVSTNPAQPITAATISVSAALLSDPLLLAVSSTGATGDGTVAESIAAWKDGVSAALGGKTPAVFLADRLSSLGNDIARADVSNTVSSDLVDGLINRREQVSGVSLDEEAADLLKNQQSFQAAAHFLTVINQLTQTAIDLLRTA